MKIKCSDHVISTHFSKKSAMQRRFVFLFTFVVKQRITYSTSESKMLGLMSCQFDTGAMRGSIHFHVGKESNL